jgi:hypothetical protein
MGDPVIAAIIAASAAIITLGFTIWNNRKIEDIKGEVSKKVQEIKNYDDTVLAATQAEYVRVRNEADLLRAEIYGSDRELRNLRLVAYSSLFAKFGGFSKDRPAPYPEQAALSGLASEMTQWYYESGGMILTAATRDIFFEVRDLLNDLANRHDPPTSWSLDSKSYGHLFNVISSFRTCLTTDTYSRVNAQLAGQSEADRNKAEANMLVAMNELDVPIKHGRLKEKEAETANELSGAVHGKAP